MRKAELTEIYIKRGYATSYGEAAEAIDNFIAVIREALIIDGKVSLQNFLSFEVVDAAPRRYVISAFDKSGVSEAKKKIRIHQTPSFKKLVEQEAHNEN